MATRIRMPEPVRVRIRRRAAHPLGWPVALLAIALVCALAWSAFAPVPLERSARAETRDAFSAQLQQRIDQLSAELQRLSDRAGDLDAQARQALADHREELQALRARAERLLERARAETGTAWAQAQPHLQKSWQELREGVSTLLGSGG